MTDAQWTVIRHFKSHEFDAKDENGKPIAGTGRAMNFTLVRMLDDVRQIVGEPLYVDSGMRTPGRNAQVGGVDSSAHLSGKAVDISAPTSRLRFKIKKAAYAVGFRRIGSGSTFVHLDADETKDQDVEWVYPSSVTRG